MPEHQFFVELEPEKRLRLDLYIARAGVLSRSQLKARNAMAKINGKRVKFSYLVKNGDFLELDWETDTPHDLIPQLIPLDVLYEDENVIVVNKAQGMVVHPAAGNWNGTLVNALLAYRLERKDAVPGEGGFAEGRPFIVHRLDKDTSGVIISAWNLAALNALQAQFKARTVRKRYIALVQGIPRDERGVIAAPIVRDSKNRKCFTTAATGGRTACTRYRVLKRFVLASGASYALLLLGPKTGRTHQIRVHLKHLGCPILGDSLYGRKDKLFPEAALALHAYSLRIALPQTNKSARFTAPLPDRISRTAARLSRKC
ncbi:MAG: RluA family pseudouridine synthase [Spirochaetaceae bacterium]|jgi:23S rRNA pseudouridine1911/1915/1917 synthase|nr:RluA family pseudouridine synthase [Spirochaetaceae bacterium]